ncbi:MAG: SMC-Scp complex subunit ScpB [Nanoarchaeota archaeon]
MVVDNLIEKLEAVLFASGKYMDLDVLKDLVDEQSTRSVKNALKKLKESYSNRKSPLMLVEQDNQWKLTVREAYLPLVRKIVADTELPKSVLETLAVIAWKSPVLQSTVIKVRTNKAYEHIDQLERLGFITRKKEGRSFRLSLSEKFYEYFDVQNGDIRKMFKDAKGIEKELREEERKHHEQNAGIKGEDEGEQIKEEISKEDAIEQAVEAEGPHLGKLEVVDVVGENKEQGFQVVDTISGDASAENGDGTDENDIPAADPDSQHKQELIDEHEIDEIVEELDEEKKAQDDIEEVLEDVEGSAKEQ